MIVSLNLRLIVTVPQHFEDISSSRLLSFWVTERILAICPISLPLEAVCLTSLIALKIFAFVFDALHFTVRNRSSYGFVFIDLTEDPLRFFEQ